MREKLRENSNKYMSKIVSMVLIITMLFGMPVESFARQAQSNADIDNAKVTQEQSVKEEPQILGELKENRDAYTKCFALDNGEKMLVQYKEPVHFKDAKGNWAVYDNHMTLAKDSLPVEESEEASTDEAAAEAPTEQDKNTLAGSVLFATQTAEGIMETDSQKEEETETQQTEPAEEKQEEYKTKNSDIDVRLSKKAKQSNMVKVKAEDYQLSWSYKDIHNSEVELINEKLDLEGNDKFIYIEKATQQAVYKEAFKDIDIEYYIHSGSVKENMILKNKNAQNEFEAQFKMKGLTAFSTDDRTIEFRNKENEVVYTLLYVCNKQCIG